MPIINWAKTHKLIVALFLVIAFLLFRNNIVLPQTSSRNLPPAKNFTGTGDLSEISPRSLSTAPQEEISKVSESKDRIVIQTSNLSLLVGDVRKVPQAVVRQLRENMGVDHQRSGGGGRDGVTVWRRRHQSLQADDAVGAGAVIDRDLLAEAI